MALAQSIPQLVALAELGCCTHLGWGSHLGCCSPGLLLQAVTSFCPLPTHLAATRARMWACCRQPKYWLDLSTALSLA